MKRLFLIDGSAVAYRSHFAFGSRPLVNRKGMQTSAAFGFTTTMLRILELEKPDLIAVVFDSPEKTFRHKEYPDYKATREKMPDEMVVQLPYIRKIVEAMRIPFLVLPPYEADDLIGTLARRAEKQGMETFIVSGDKDFYQLLSPLIHLYQLKKGGETEVIGIDGPVQKWGVTVAQVIDLLAMMGDSSDNVPGIPGVGEKTATKLLQQYGSMDDIYKNLESVTPATLREKLATNRDKADLCKRLVTIHIDVPVPVTVDELEKAPFDVPRLQSLYDELDFRILLEKLSNEAAVRTTPGEKENYQLVTTRAELNALVATLTKTGTFAVDTETTSLHPLDADPVGLSFSCAAGTAYYVPLRNHELDRDLILDTLRPILENPDLRKGGQNTKYDMNVLKNVGIKMRGMAFDTMIESYLLDPEGSHGLDALARKHLGVEKIRTEELIGKKGQQISMADVDVKKVSHYACEDADMTWRLHELFSPQIEHQELERLYRDVELPIVDVLADMEYRGIKVDADLLRSLSKTIDERLKKITETIYQAAGETFNLNSPKQLGPILFEKLRIQEVTGNKRVKKTKTGYSTDQETLENYSDHPIIASLLEYRNLSKLKSTYTDSLPTLIHRKTGRIHASFNQTVASTGRLSSSDPNLQNIPIRTDLGKEVRKAFVPGEPGWKIVSADYSQVELRILAHLSEDPVLIETFRRNEDIHRRTASLVFDVPFEKVSSELRGRAKAINFGILYGMGPQRLSRETGISMDEAKSFIEAYFEKYSGIRKYIDGLIQGAKDRGFVTTILGRRRPIPDITSSNPRLASNAERIAVNTPIQGSAADLIKVAMINIHREFQAKGYKAGMLIQVHDELVFEVPEEELNVVVLLIKKEMERAIPLRVPVVVDVGIGSNWAEAH